MKSFILLLIVCLLHSRCRNEHNQRVVVAHDGYDKPDTTCYPQLIEGGKRIVYQFGHLTPDKGLKLYLDTIAYGPGSHLDDSVRQRLSLE